MVLVGRNQRADDSSRYRPCVALVRDHKVMSFRKKLLEKMETLGGLWFRIERVLHFPSAARAIRTGVWRAKLGSMGKGSHIHPHVVVHSADKVQIGENVNIVEFVHIWGGGGVKIGDNVLIATHAVITSETHEKCAERFRDSSRRSQVEIGNDCWIGSGAIVFPGVKIGEGSIVGAQTVVTKSFPPRSVIVGVPGRLKETLEPIGKGRIE